MEKQVPADVIWALCFPAEYKDEKGCIMQGVTADLSRTSRHPEKKRASRKISSEIMALMKSKRYSLQVGSGKLFTGNNIFSEM